MNTYVPTDGYGANVECTPETCAIATGATLELEVEYYETDLSYAVKPERVIIEPEGVIETVSISDKVRVRALAPGDVAMTFEKMGSDRVYSVTQHFQVRDIASVQVVPVRDEALVLAPDDRLRVIDGSTITLRADRYGSAGEYLFGATQEPWTASPGATLTLIGTTGTQKKLEVHGVGSLDVSFGLGTLPVDVVPVTDVARVELRLEDEHPSESSYPSIVAGDGQTLRVPDYYYGYVYVLDAYDASGHYVAGSGAPGDIAVDSPGIRALSVERSYDIYERRDQVVTAKVGPVMSVVTVDFE